MVLTTWCVRVRDSVPDSFLYSLPKPTPQHLRVREGERSEEGEKGGSGRCGSHRLKFQSQLCYFIDV